MARPVTPPPSGRSPKQVAEALRELEMFRAAGYDPFPLARRSKRPAHKGWQGNDYTSFDWKEWFRIGGNAGLRLGARDVVVDFDPRNAAPGDDPVARLGKAVGVDLRRAPRVLTGSGGEHYFFKLSEGVRLRAKLDEFQGVDFKRIGGFVVAAGSVHPETGKTYRLDPTGPDPAKVSRAPEGLVDLVRRPDRAERVESSGVLEPGHLALLLTALNPRDFGQGEYDAWITLCAACHDATAGDGLAEFQEWCASDPEYNFPESFEAVERHWESFQFGRSGGVTARTLYHEVAQAGHASLVQELVGEAARDAAVEALAAEPLPDVAEKGEEPKREARWRLWEMDELGNEPPIEWLAHKVLPERGLGMFYGFTKSHKTFAALALALCIATGKDFYGIATKRGKVVYVIGEGQSDLYDRVAAWCAANKVDVEELRGQFRAVTAPVLLDGKEAAEFANAIAAKRPYNLLVFDTVARCLSGDENSQEAMSAFVKGCDALREKFKTAVLIIHHTGWGGQRVRGSSVLLAAVDVSVQVKLVSETTRETRLLVEHIRAAPPGLEIYLAPQTVVTADDRDSIVLRQIEQPDKVAPASAKEVEALEREFSKYELLVEICERRPSLQKEMERPGRSRATVSRRVKELCEEGLLLPGGLVPTKAGLAYAREFASKGAVDDGATEPGR